MKFTNRLFAGMTAAAVSAAMISFAVSADVTPADGIPVKSGTFRDTAYYDSTRPLKLANNFHIFAFDEVTINAHCNGNFAAPNANVNHANGTNQYVHDVPTREASVVTKNLNMGGTTLAADLYLPMNAMITNANGEYTVTNPVSGQIKINGNLVDMNSPFEKNIYHVGEDFIDFASEKVQYMNLSENLSKAAETVTGENRLFEGSNAYITLADEGMNVLNITGEELHQAQSRLNIKNAVFDDFDGDGDSEYSGLQSLVINVDVAGSTYEQEIDGVSTKIFNTGSEIRIYRSDSSEVGNKEANVLDGTIVLWNFYDSSSEDGLYHGTVNIDKAFLGSIVAPCAKIAAGQNVDGNIIANKVETYAESHRCDFMGPLNVSWENASTTTTTTTSATTTTSETTTTTTTSATTTTSESTTTTTTTSSNTTTTTTTPATTTSSNTTTTTTTPATTTSSNTTTTTTTPATTSSNTTTTTTTPATTTSSNTTTTTTTPATTTSSKTTTTTTTPATTTSSKTTTTTTTPATTTSSNTTTTTTTPATTTSSNTTTTTTTPATTTSSNTTTTTTTPATTTSSKTTTTTTTPATTTSSETTTTTTPATTTSSETTTTTPATMTSGEGSLTSGATTTSNAASTTTAETTTTGEATTTSEEVTTTTAPETTTTTEETTTTAPETTTEEEETTTTSSTTVDESDKEKTTTTTSDRNVNNDDKNKVPQTTTSNSNVNNGASDKSPDTGSNGFASIAVVSMLTASAALFIGKKKLDDEDK